MKFLRRGFMRFQGSAVSKCERAAFTLVELLVVIGIIALLISILLPALSSARKQAQTVKCEAAMRDIGNALLMYVQENGGWTPPAKLIGGTYDLYGTTFNGAGGQSPYWFNFLSKYETKTAMGFAATTGNQVSTSQQSVFWGCPAWTAYNYNGSTATNPLNVSTQIGYGMNGFPEYTPSYPPRNFTLGESTLSPNPAYVNAVDTPTYSTTSAWTPPASGKWYKFTSWTHASDRALFGDCIFWFMEARSPLSPPNMAAQYTLTNNATWASEGDSNNATTFDFYRHGSYPQIKAGTSDEFSVTGGKVRYNVLFADNHVTTLIDRGEGYKAARMRYPG